MLITKHGITLILIEKMIKHYLMLIVGDGLQEFDVLKEIKP